MGWIRNLFQFGFNQNFFSISWTQMQTWFQFMVRRYFYTGMYPVWRWAQTAVRWFGLVWLSTCTDVPWALCASPPHLLHVIAHSLTAASFPLQVFLLNHLSLNHILCWSLILFTVAQHDSICRQSRKWKYRKVEHCTTNFFRNKLAATSVMQPCA